MSILSRLRFYPKLHKKAGKIKDDFPELSIEFKKDLPEDVVYLRMLREKYERKYQLNQGEKRNEK